MDQNTPGIVKSSPKLVYTTRVEDHYWSFVDMQNPVQAIPNVKTYMLHVDSNKYHSTQEIKDVFGWVLQESSSKDERQKERGVCD